MPTARVAPKGYLVGLIILIMISMRPAYATPPDQVVAADGEQHRANWRFLSQDQQRKYYVDLNSFRREAAGPIVSALAYVDTGKNHVVTELMALWFSCSEHRYSLAPGMMILSRKLDKSSNVPKDPVQPGSTIQTIEALACKSAAAKP